MAKDPEKVRANNRKWRERHREKHLARRREQWAATREQRMLAQEARRQAQPLLPPDVLMCTQCQQTKPAAHFSRNTNAIARGGRDYCCKACKKAASHEHYQRNIARIRSQHHAYAKAHRAKNAAYKKTWVANNRERVNAGARARYQATDAAVNRLKNAKNRTLLLIRYPTYHRDYLRAWAKTHQEQKLAQDRRYRQRHPEKQAEMRRAKDARKRHAPINDLSHAQWEEIQAAQDHRCYYCGKRCKGHLTQDHILALSKGGSHTVSNVIGACRSCNSKKHTGPAPLAVQPLLFTVAPPRKKRRAS